MKTTPATIVTRAEQLLADIERVAGRFPRRCRYTLGQDLRQWGYQAVLLAQRAWRAAADKGRQATLLGQLIERIDQIKLGLQMAHRLQAFTSSGAFEHVATLAHDVGRQAGGWHKHIQQHLQGQNPGRSTATERAQTLSSPAAPKPLPAGVNP